VLYSVTSIETNKTHYLATPNHNYKVSGTYRNDTKKLIILNCGRLLRMELQ